jgi:peroxiredoxin Q/BCP
MNAPTMNRVVKNFKAAATRNKTIELKELRGQNVVIYFYPKDRSRDSIASHEKFRDKQNFPFDLISDPDEVLCKQFDVIHEKSLYGKKFMGIVRSTFLIDASGKLRQEWRKVKVNGHADEVFEAVKALN